MPENVKLHPHENCNCAHDGVALPQEIVLEVKNLTKKFQVPSISAPMRDWTAKDTSGFSVK